MWDSSMTIMLLEGTRDTLYMTLLATFFGYVFGLPMGIALMVTAKDGIQPSSRVDSVCMQSFIRFWM